MFRIGQKVWSFTLGWGEVISGNAEDVGPSYTVCVKFDKGGRVEWYDSDGKYYANESRTLFFREIPIPEDALIPPKQELVLCKGDIVVFKDGTLGFVNSFSGVSDNSFSWHRKIPLNLDDAFDGVHSYKKDLDRVVGNIDG